MASNEAVVAVEDLRMRYGPVDVLRGVTFDIRGGEVLALLGPNGAGKSTTIEILEGFRMRSSGAVSVLGVDPAHGDELWRARVGIVLQSWRDHAKWRVGELLDYQGSYYRPYGTEATPRPWPVPDLLEAVGLTDRRDTLVGRLSGGQRRRLDVAIGLVGRPELLLLDEPTTGFDPQARHEFHQIIRAAATRFRTSVLLTTHDLGEAEQLADRVAILVDGVIVAAGTPADLAHRFAGREEVRWTERGRAFRHEVDDAAAFVRRLYARDGEAVRDLEVRRTSLETTYLALMRDAEAERRTEGITDPWTPAP